MAKQGLVQLKAPPMTVAQKKMWSEYVKARKAAAPEAALKKWARKYKVRLMRGNRVAHREEYGGAKKPPPRPLEFQKNCQGICFIKNYERWTKIGAYTSATNCDLAGCMYDKVKKRWYCVYECVTVTHFGT